MRVDHTDISSIVVKHVKDAARVAARRGSELVANEEWALARLHFSVAYDTLASIGLDSDDVVDQFASDMPDEQW